MTYRTETFQAVVLSLVIITVLVSMYYLADMQIVSLNKNLREQSIENFQETSVAAFGSIWKSNNTNQITSSIEHTQPYNESRLSNKTTTEILNLSSTENLFRHKQIIYLSGHKIFNPNLCPNLGFNINIVVLITSAPDHFTFRTAIRMTWGHFGQRRDIAISFVVGSTLNDTVQRRLNHEFELYGDIIQGNFIDSYDNLTLKTLSMLEWVDRYCNRARFFLKTDDDMYINIPKLLQFTARHWNDTRIIYGCLRVKGLPFRDESSKYYVSYDQYSSELFPDFTSGPAYLITMDSVKDLFLKSLQHSFFRLEDVFITGIVAEALNISRVYVREFFNDRVPLDTCTVKDAISIHMVTYKEQFKLWAKLMDISKICKNNTVLDDYED